MMRLTKNDTFIRKYQEKMELKLSSWEIKIEALRWNFLGITVVTFTCNLKYLDIGFQWLLINKHWLVIAY